jgi:hypothetical protein
MARLRGVEWGFNHLTGSKVDFPTFGNIQYYLPTVHLTEKAKLGAFICAAFDRDSRCVVRERPAN